MMQAVLFDTSVYITALRTKDAPPFTLSGLAGGAVVWLSSSWRNYTPEPIPEAAPKWKSWSVIFQRTRRILVPNLTDWTQAGRVLSLMSAK